MEFCDKFLQLVAKKMQNIDSPHEVFRFEYDPTQASTVFMQSHSHPNQFGFLPEWFIREMETATEEGA